MAATKKVKKTKSVPKTEVAKAEAPRAEAPKTEIQIGESGVRVDQLRQAIGALAKYAEAQNPQEQMIFDDSSQSLVVQFTLDQCPKKKFKAVTIALPHPLWNEKTEACLVVKEPQRKYKDMLQENPRPAIKKVIDVKKWKQRHELFKDRREICDAFELFLIDDRCAEMTPSLFGKVFSSRNKTPLPVKVTQGFAGIDKVLKATTMKICGGLTVGVRFGRVNFKEEELVANCQAVIEFVVEYFKAKKTGVTTISIQGSGCPALPVYRASFSGDLEVQQSRAERKMIKSKKRTAQKKKAGKAVIKDEPKTKSKVAKVKADSDNEEKVKANVLSEVKVVEPKVPKSKGKTKKSKKTKA